MSLARMTALVEPWGPSVDISLICDANSVSNAREIALRVWGLLRERTRMLPLWGAGIERIFINDVDVLL